MACRPEKMELELKREEWCAGGMAGAEDVGSPRPPGRPPVVCRAAPPGREMPEGKAMPGQATAG